MSRCPELYYCITQSYPFQHLITACSVILKHPRTGKMDSIFVQELSCMTIDKALYVTGHRKHDGNSICQFTLFAIIDPLSVSIFNY